jgi:hypothetical protein
MEISCTVVVASLLRGLCSLHLQKRSADRFSGPSGGNVMSQLLKRVGIIRKARRDAFGYLPKQERDRRFYRPSTEETR